ncbi:transcriptional repressor LexA [Bartonella sp. CM120XJJH]|uniref:transcriptional repressor LexA n=1 Tax=Bartonella sp. CM120XJJH TaxID=3243544 RepID=UPI0035D06D7D
MPWGYPPTEVQEFAVELGVKGPSVFEGLKRLEDKGYIRRQARKARFIEILHAQTSYKTNLTAVFLLGMVAACQPILALENWIGQVMMPSSVLHGKYFALKVQGDSVIDADIFKGDYVVVHQQPIAKNSDIVGAMVSEEATVKRLTIEGEHIELHPENQKLKPIIIGQQDELKIIGKDLQVCSGTSARVLTLNPPPVTTKQKIGDVEI